MPVPPAPTALVLLPVLLLIVAAVRTLRARRLPEPDIYEPGHHLSPAEAADIEAGFEPVYLPTADGPTQPAGPGGDQPTDADALQAEADAAEARLLDQFAALDELLRRTDDRFPAADPARPATAPASAAAPGRSKR
ncbi:hypothetical protein OG871_39920 (plasmid) [Kitasatospora sp. NBC_00374]|uniref:hypothetical protein n=1 Tax=Kitasatospora sp. NBC_00374 TaxID=2975964 RepID=UPI002F914231